VRSTLLLPATWTDQAAFTEACARAGLSAAGAFVVDALTGTHVEVELTPRNETMRRAFTGFEIEGEELDAIEAHRSVLRVTAETGDLERVRSLTGLATAVGAVRSVHRAAVFRRRG
jgi:hypothetical protein